MPEPKKAAPSDQPPTNGRGDDRATVLKESASDIERQRDAYLDLLQRTQAEFANYQKRAERNLAEELQYANAPLARELTAVLDNLQQALEAAQKGSDADSLAKGVSLVQSQLLDVLARFGVRPIDAFGQPFDPHRHEALLQDTQSDAPPGTVVEVIQPGYRLHERVLRPAKVIVAAVPEAKSTRTDTL